MMDALQQPTDDSFSYRWLLNLKPAFDAVDDPYRSSLDALDEAYYIEVDPKMAHLKRTDTDAQHSNFDFPISQPLAFVHADELFSNGLLLPIHLLSPPKTVSPDSNDQYSIQVLNRPSSRPESASSSSSTAIVLSTSALQSAFFQRCRRSSKRIFSKYLGFLRPLYRKVCSKRPALKMVNCVESLQVTPRTSSTLSTADWSRSNILFNSDIDNLIQEAVLHCKKSTEKQGVMGQLE